MPEPPTTPFDVMKVAELRAELTKRGLSTAGVKKDLLARLSEATSATPVLPKLVVASLSTDDVPPSTPTRRSTRTKESLIQTPARRSTRTKSTEDPEQETTALDQPITVVSSEAAPSSPPRRGSRRHEKETPTQPVTQTLNFCDSKTEKPEKENDEAETEEATADHDLGKSRPPVTPSTKSKNGRAPRGSKLVKTSTREVVENLAEINEDTSADIESLKNVDTLVETTEESNSSRIKNDHFEEIQSSFDISSKSPKIYDNKKISKIDSDNMDTFKMPELLLTNKSTENTNDLKKPETESLKLATLNGKFEFEANSELVLNNNATDNTERRKLITESFRPTKATEKEKTNEIVESTLTKRKQNESEQNLESLSKRPRMVDPIENEKSDDHSSISRKRKDTEVDIVEPLKTILEREDDISSKILNTDDPNKKSKIEKPEKNTVSNLPPSKPKLPPITFSPLDLYDPAVATESTKTTSTAIIRKSTIAGTTSIVAAKSVTDPALRIVPQASIPSTDTILVSNFVRPLQVSAVKELLEQYGDVKFFWMDKIKTHCYATFNTVANATKARESVYGITFPPEHGRLLTADYISSEKALKNITEQESKLINNDRRFQENTRKKTDFFNKPEFNSRRLVGVAAATLQSAADAGGIKGKDEAVKRKLEIEKQRIEAPKETLVEVDKLFHKTKASPFIYWKPVKEIREAQGDQEIKQ